MLARPLAVYLALACALLTFAAEPAWKNKQAAEWTAADARQILMDSPWVKNTAASIRPLQTEDQRREGGQMGQEHGVGFDGLADDRPRAKLPTGLIDLVKPESQTPRPLGTLSLLLRWESALPVQVAEMKTRDVDSPTLGLEGYCISVYGVPRAHVAGDPKTLGIPLKAQAVLKRDGKKDVRPINVEVIQRDEGTIVVYLFPLSAEISPNDHRVEFDADIGRIAISQLFDLDEMRLDGKLQL